MADGSHGKNHRKRRKTGENLKKTNIVIDEWAKTVTLNISVVVY